MGKLDKETWSDCVSGVWSESKGAPVGTLELPSLKDLQFQQSHSLGLGV